MTVARDAIVDAVPRGASAMVEHALSEDATTARLACRGLVRELCSTSAFSENEKLDVVRALSGGLVGVHPSAACVDELCRNLVSISTNGVEVEALCTEALSSLSASVSQAAASALTRGIVELCCAGTQFHGSSCSASSHPMTRALRAHRDAGAALLDTTASKLSAGGPQEFDAMKRFIMRSLLEHPAPPPRSAFPSLLHARLMAVVSGNGKNTNSVLKLCVQAFGAYRSPTSEAQAWIATVAADIVDAIECRLYEFDEQDVLELVPVLVRGLVRQTRAAVLSGGSALPFIGALKRLSEYGDIRDCVALVSCLSMTSDIRETSALLALMSSHLPTEGPAKTLTASHAQAILALPKDVGADLALSFVRTLQKVNIEPGSSTKNNLGYSTQEGILNGALSSVWDAKESQTLESCLQSSNGSHLLELICLAHPNANVRVLAAEKLSIKLNMKPSHAASSITVGLLCVKSECERTSDVDVNSLLASLRALASGSANFIAAPTILRAITPLLGNKSGESGRLHALALRILTEMWIHNRELGPRLCAALESASNSHDSAVVLGCAAAVAAAARAHPFRATELVVPMQACLESKLPAAQALALEAIDIMCEHDALDFLPAFKVVIRHMPTRPEHPLVGQMWIKLLRHSGSIASTSPDVVSTFVQHLWEAIKVSAIPAVRREAWNALQSYNLEFIAKVGEPTVGQISQAALDEEDPSVAERIVHALRHLARDEAETLSRTVFVARERTQSHAPPTDALVYKVTQSIPKKINETRRYSPDRLLLFRPEKPKIDLSRSVDQWAFKRQRAEEYRKEFSQASKQISWNGWWHGKLASQSWARFARRWYDAEVAARSAENGIEELHEEVQTSMYATAMDALKEVSTPDELQNIAMLLASPALSAREGQDAKLLDLLLSSLDAKTSVSGSERGLFTAICLIAGRLSDRSDEQRPRKVANILIERVADCRSDGLASMGVAADALGSLCRGLSQGERHGLSSKWREDLICHICNFLCDVATALGSQTSFLDVLNLKSTRRAIHVPKGDVIDALIGAYSGLSQAVCALDVFSANTTELSASLFDALIAKESIALPDAIALLCTLKVLLIRQHTREMENRALRGLITMKNSDDLSCRLISGVALGIMLDHGCIVSGDILNEISHTVVSSAQDGKISTSLRSLAVLSLAGMLGGTWDGLDDFDVQSIGAFDEGSTLSSPLIWSNEKAKSEARRVIKTLENLSASPQEKLPHSLQTLSSWMLARLSDRTAQIAVSAMSGSSGSGFSISKDTVIGLMMSSIIEAGSKFPSLLEVQSATTALCTLEALPRLPDANWSVALKRWWQIATSPDLQRGPLRDSLQYSCIKMCCTHPGVSVGREVLESTLKLTATEFASLSIKTQHLIMSEVPRICEFRRETAVDNIQKFVDIAHSRDASKDCVIALWTGLSNLTEGVVASTVICALSPRLPSPGDEPSSIHFFDQIGNAVKRIKSSKVLEDVIRNLTPRVRPVICAHLLSQSKFSVESLVSLSVWPDSTRVATLKIVAPKLSSAPLALKVQMLHEATRLPDDSLSCVSILAAAFGPSETLLPLMSVEQCILSLPYNLPLLIRGDMSGLTDTLVTGLLKHLRGQHAQSVHDTLCELVTDLSSNLLNAVLDTQVQHLV